MWARTVGVRRLIIFTMVPFHAWVGQVEAGDWAANRAPPAGGHEALGGAHEARGALGTGGRAERPGLACDSAYTVQNVVLY